MARANNLIFEDAIKARDSITSSQRKDIAKLYEQWAKEIGKTAEKFGKKTNSSAPLSEAYMNQLKKQLETTGINVASNVEKKIKDNMLTIADNVIADNAKWLQDVGFSKGKINAAFSYVPNDVVERLVTGKVYQSGWSLGKAIWGDSKDTLSKVYEIVAGGFAKQQSIYEIAKDLESFVSPSAKKMWNLTDKDGRRIYPKMVDYSAQRLARTLAQHTYQQAFQEATKDNPFVLKYKWVSNGSRVCDICKKRDGKLYDKDKLPLDHPNGMCVIEPVTMNKGERLDKLADWVKGKEGDYPEIDAFAKRLGFTGSNKINNVSNSTFVSNTPANVSRKNYFSEYDDMNKLRNLLMESGKFDFDQIFAIGNDIDALRKAADSIYEDAWNAADVFRKKYSLTGSTEEITNYLRQINLDDLPSTMNDASVYQKYSLIKNSSDMPELVDDLSGDGIQIFRSVKSANGLSASMINEMTKYDKDTFIGSGVFGDGIYFSSSKSGAGVYGAEEAGSVLYAEIKDTAKIIDYDLLVKMKKEAGQGNADDAIFAAEHGFDVISKVVNRNEEGEVYYCVLKRSALKIKR